MQISTSFDTLVVEFRTNVNIDNASADGNLSWRYGGVRLFFKASY